jgi:uncharacterized protein (DUF2141 family)
MKRLVLVFTVIFCASFSPEIKAQDQNGNITVLIGPLRNSKGHLLISLFNSADKFPDDASGAVKSKKVKVDKTNQKIIFDNVPFGEYAIVFLHDENDSGDMDTNMMGIPQEGYGASNNAVNTFSAPKYKEAKFRLSSTNTTQSLKVYY